MDRKDDVYKSDSPVDEQKEYLGTLERQQSEVNDLGQKNGEHLQHALKPRHVAMISIGGVIGTGLFLGTANSLKNGGPLGLWLGYIVMGSVCYAVMQCLGEAVSYLPVPGGHIRLADRFVSPAMAFALGWNYWYNWVIVLPAELSAAAVLISYWDPNTSPAVYITVCLVVVVAINLLGARVYGEAEFWFCSIKVITIVGLIILSFLIDVGVGSQGVLGFHYWKHPGPFVQYNNISGSLGRFLGFWSVLINAAFSFIGTEITGIAAGEARNPRKAIPSAVRKVFYRILLFYILGTLAISVICPSDAPDLSFKHKTATKSPFVIAIKAAGIKGLPSVINAALLTSATSAASSDLYTSSRALYGLALNGQAPRIFARTNRYGLPYLSVFVSILFSLLAYMSVKTGSGTAFGYFANLTSVCGLVTWSVIGCLHLRFRTAMKVQGVSDDVLPYKAPLSKFFSGKFFSYYTIGWTLLVILFCDWSVFLNGNWSTSDFITNYFPVPFFGILYAFGAWRWGGAFRKAEEIDLHTGLQTIIDNEVEEPKPTNLWEKVWAYIA
jgi:yeast amino acid transporter